MQAQVYSPYKAKHWNAGICIEKMHTSTAIFERSILWRKTESTHWNCKLQGGHHWWSSKLWMIKQILANRTANMWNLTLNAWCQLPWILLTPVAWTWLQFLSMRELSSLWACSTVRWFTGVEIFDVDSSERKSKSKTCLNRTRSVTQLLVEGKK